MIAMVDYRAGNLTSVARALQSLNVPCVVTDRADELRRAERVIFPGVGAAGEAMRNLRETGLAGCIRDLFDSGKPLLGICLGTQVIFEYSEEEKRRVAVHHPFTAPHPDDIGLLDTEPLKLVAITLEISARNSSSLPTA